MIYALSSVGTQYLIIGIAAAFAFAAFFVFLLTPALAAFGRSWEKLVAAVLSVYVLLALATIGVGIGLIVVYYWDSITDII